jgi:PAS domain S-box-containing protein
MQVLIVDDEPDALELLRRTLAVDGYEVEAACNGVEAMEFLKSRPFQIVVADVNMPLMGGMELCQAIRKADLPEYVYIILLTGQDDLKSKLCGLSAGADDYIVKSSEPSELLARIKVGERVLQSELAQINKALKAQIVHRESIEHELRNSQKRYRILTEAAPVGIFHADPSGKFIYVNQRWQEITGAAGSALHGRAWTDFLHADDKEQVMDGWKLAQKDGTPFRGEFRFVKQDGSTMWVFGQAIAEIDDDGELVGYVGTVTDITESKRAHQEVSRLAAIVECSNDAIISESLDGTIMTWNGGAERVYGYSKSEVIGRPMAILLPADRLTEEKVFVESIRRGECVEDFETQRIRKDGSRIDVSLTLSPIRDASNQIVGASKIAKDITERRKVEAALRENEQRYHFLADIMPQMVWTAGSRGNNEYFNAGWMRYTGLSEQVALGSGWLTVLHEEDRATTLTQWSKAVRTGKPFEMEHRFLRGSDGAYRWHLSRALPLKDDAGRIVQWFGTCTDVHDQKLISQELEAKRHLLEVFNVELSAKNNKLGELYKTAHNFVDDVSHEFRTPLTVIKEFASIIRDGLAGGISVEQGEYLDIIRNRVDDLATMVDDMLDISKLESGMLGVCRRNWTVDQIIEHVRSTLERKASAHKMKLEYEFEADLPMIYCDLEKIGRVIINLTVNALKFSREKGCVKLCVHRSDDDCSTVTVSVTDNGPGIAPEDVTVIFNRFKQLGDGLRAGTKGFGLGLNIARELIRLNYGEIGLRSELSRGSTFFFSIPIADPVIVVKLWTKLALRGTHDSVTASLLTIRCDSDCPANLLGELDQFLQGNLRYSDVLICITSNEWVMVSTADEHEICRMVQRIEHAWQEENRNRPGDPLPGITIKIQATYTLPGQELDFMNGYEELLAREVCQV